MHADPGSPAGLPVAAPPAPSPKKTWLIVLAIVAALLLCCCITLVGLVALGIIAEPETVLEEVATELSEESAPDPGDQGIYSRDAGVEVQRMTERYYPGYEHEMYAIVASGDADARLHVIAFPPDPSLPRILFEATRVEGDWSDHAPSETEFVDPESGALWTHDTGPSGLQAWAGPDAFAPHDQVGALFTDAHPAGDLLVTDYGMLSNVQVRLGGVHESEIDAWDRSTSWESVWDLDIAGSTWIESSFTP